MSAPITFALLGSGSAAVSGAGMKAGAAAGASGRFLAKDISLRLPEQGLGSHGIHVMAFAMVADHRLSAGRRTTIDTL